MPSPSELNARIHELEKQIKELEAKLAEYTKVEEYYLKRYQEIFAETKKARDEEIKQTLENITSEISHLKHQKDDVASAMEENMQITKQIKEIDFQLQELYRQNEVSSLDAESEITELEQTGLQTIIQHQEQMRKYVNKFNKLLIIPFNTDNIIFLKDAMLNYLYGEGFDSVKLLKQNNRGALLIKKTFEKKNKEYQETISQLQLDKAALIDRFHSIEADALDNIQRDIGHYTLLQEKYYDDILHALELTKEKHQKVILDKIQKCYVLGYSKDAIGSEMDLLLNILNQELLTIDTVENKVYQKEKRLQKLQKEASRLHELDLEKETLNAEYKELQTKYLGIQKQVQVIEEFNAKVHEFIDNNDNYYSIAMYYLQFMSYESSILEQISKLKTELSDLQAVEDNKYEEDIKRKEKEIDTLERSLEEANIKLEEVRANPENEKVIKMLLSVKEYEEALPDIYKTLETLKTQIDEKYERLNVLKEQLVEYQSILLQIEGLTDESLD